MTDSDIQDPAGLAALEEWCTDFCSGADTGALLRLLTTRSGVFHPVSRLLHAEDSPHSRALAALEARHGVHVQALWSPVPAPSGTEGDGWAAVVFYVPEHNALAQSALLNRAFLRTRYAQ